MALPSLPTWSTRVHACRHAHPPRPPHTTHDPRPPPAATSRRRYLSCPHARPPARQIPSSRTLSGHKIWRRPSRPSVCTRPARQGPRRARRLPAPGGVFYLVGGGRLVLHPHRRAQQVHTELELPVRRHPRPRHRRPPSVVQLRHRRQRPRRRHPARRPRRCAAGTGGRSPAGHGRGGRDGGLAGGLARLRRARAVRWRRLTGRREALARRGAILCPASLLLAVCAGRGRRSWPD